MKMVLRTVVMKIIFMFPMIASVMGTSVLKGTPVPGATILDRVLSKYLNRSDYTDAIFDYLLGNDNARRSDTLGVDVLDRENVLNLLKDVKRRDHSLGSRRYEYTKYEAYYEDKESDSIKETALDLMKQSIYSAKFRMNDTRRFRKYYQDDPSFHIAVYYGALMQVSNKMTTLYSMIKKIDQWTHFLWFLVIYEKILAANVDAHDMVDRIFDLNDKFDQMGKAMGKAMTGLMPTIQTQSTRRRRRRRSTTPTTG